MPVPALSGAYLVPGSEESGPSGSYWTSRPLLPEIIGGYGSSLAFGSEMERSNYIRGGLTLQSTYDDNALLASPAITNYTYSIFPQVSLDQTRSRVRWLLNYAGGFTYNDKLTNQNQTSQRLNFDLQYRLSPHVNFRVTEALGLTTGLFGPVNSLNGSAPGIPVGANPFVLTPLAKTFNSVLRADISYQFSASDVVGASGGWNVLKNRDTPPGTVFVDTQGEDAAGYYMHRVTTSNWLGGSYIFHHFGYSPVVNDSNVHSVVGFDTWQLKPSMTLSVFVGPQYSNNRLPTNTTASQATFVSMWSISGGASYSLQARHTSIELSYARRIADGGGLLGSVELNSVIASVRHRVSPRWTIALFGDFGGNDALAALGAPSESIHSASGGLTVTRQIGERYFLQAGYSRQNQTTTGLTSLSGDASRNFVIASFSYQFARPWGR